MWNTTLLVKTLAVAVPLHIGNLARMATKTRDQTIRHWARDGADQVASRGDVLQYGGRRGEAAAAFNALARGLAALAYAQGGVTWQEMHWCAATHPNGVRCTDRLALRCETATEQQTVNRR